MVSSALNRSQEFLNHVHISYLPKSISKSGTTMDKYMSEDEFLKSVDYIQLNDSEEVQ